MIDKVRSNKNSDIYSLRTKRLTSSLNKINLDNYIVLKDENVFYLTGFYGKDSNSILLISLEKSYLLVNFIYYEETKKNITNPNIKVVLYKNNRFKKLVEIVKSLNSKSIGIEGTVIDHISYTKLENMLSKTDSALIPKPGLIEDLRIIKDASEIKDIKKACKITDKVFEDLLNLSRDQISRSSELELGHEIERLMIKEGGDGRSFDFVIASGKGSSMPHYIASHKKIKNGVLLMDFGTIYKNYCSDITRTIFVDSRSSNDKLRKIYDIVLNAQQKAIEACREDVSCGELDSIAREYIVKQGYGEKFGHGLGHGVGLEVHEGPTITKKNKTILRENMVITIEPGIYVPELGGIRIEDMVIVKKNGCENLYNSKKEFTIIS